MKVILISSLLLGLAACGSSATGSICPTEQTLTYENFGQPFFANYCTRCHSHNPPDGDRHGAPADHNLDLIEHIREEIKHIDEYAAAGPDAENDDMPPSDPKPSKSERRQLGEWLACGAP